MEFVRFVLFCIFFFRCNVFIGIRNLKKNKDVEKYEEEREDFLLCILYN